MPGTFRSASHLSPLQAADVGRAEFRHQRRIVAKRRVRPPPANVLNDGDHRREVPAHAGGGALDGRGLGHAAGQVGIAGRAQADQVGENGRAADVVVAVDGIDAIEQRDAQARGKGLILEGAHHVGPGGGGVGRGVAAAAAQDAAQRQRGHIAGAHAVFLRLGHLADLLGQGHLGQQVFYFCLDILLVHRFLTCLKELTQRREGAKTQRREEELTQRPQERKA